MIIDGKKTAEDIAINLAKFISNNNISSKLVVIQVGNNPISSTYISYKQKKATELGIASELVKLSEATTTQELITIIEKQNQDNIVNGIIVQMPLPKHIEKTKINCAINPNKDVDGFHPTNVGKLNLGITDGLVACTPMGCLHLIRSITQDISGLNAVIIGRSNIVGKPMASLLLNNNASVSILHSKTNDIAKYTKNADIIVACTGQAGLIANDMVKNDAIIIDVGVTKLESGKTIGDTDFEELKGNVRAITPPIGGVGPMTIIMLMYNTIKAYCQQNGINDFETECGIFI